MGSTILLALLLIIMIASFVIWRRSKSAESRTLAEQASPKADETSSARSRGRNHFEDEGSYDEGNGSISTTVGRYTSIGALITFAVSTFLFVVGLFLSMTYSQDPGDASVVKSFTGKVTDVDTTPGLGFLMPWEDVVTFDVRNVTLEFVNKGESGIGKDGPAIIAPLAGSSNATINFTATISINPECVGEIYNEYKSEANFRTRRLTPVVRDQVRNASTAYDPFRIKEQREILGSDIRTRLEDEWVNDCVIIQDINLGDIVLDLATEQAITNVNVKKQEVEAARSELEASKIQAETVRVDALAQADADQIIRCGAETDTTTEIIGGEEQTVIIITPNQGEDCQNLLNEQVLMAKWLDTLEELGKNGNVTIVIPNDPGGGLDLQPRIDIPVPTSTIP